MLDLRKRQSLARERLLAEAVKGFASELRLVEVVDFVAFLRMEQHGNIADLVASSAELHFKPGVLRYADSGEVDLGWNTRPVIALSMQFSYGPVAAHFRLELASASAAVDITYVAFDPTDPDPEANTAAFARALAEARIMPTAGDA